jgi:hypothetical protein
MIQMALRHFNRSATRRIHFLPFELTYSFPNYQANHLLLLQVFFRKISNHAKDAFHSVVERGQVRELALSNGERFG